MGMMDWMMEKMMNGMSKEDKETMMDGAMAKMMGDMTVEEKQEMMATMMPKMMEGVSMVELMPKMMLTMMPMMFDEVKGILAEQGKDLDMMEIMPKVMGPFMSGMLDKVPAETMVEHKEHMMDRIFEEIPVMKEKIPARQMEMMPGCMRRLMENISYDEKVRYAQHNLGILVEKGTDGLEDGQRTDYLASLRTCIPVA